MPFLFPSSSASTARAPSKRRASSCALTRTPWPTPPRFPTPSCARPKVTRPSRSCAARGTLSSRHSLRVRLPRCPTSSAPHAISARTPFRRRRKTKSTASQLCATTTRSPRFPPTCACRRRSRRQSRSRARSGLQMSAVRCFHCKFCGWRRDANGLFSVDIVAEYLCTHGCAVAWLVQRLEGRGRAALCLCLRRDQHRRLGACALSVSPRVACINFLCRYTATAYTNIELP